MSSEAMSIQTQPKTRRIRCSGYYENDWRMSSKDMAEQPRLKKMSRHDDEVLHEHQDRLSALPDDILVLILERLCCTRQAMAASILSRRWTHIPRLLPVLSLYADDFFPETEPDDHDDEIAVSASWTPLDWKNWRKFRIRAMQHGMMKFAHAIYCLLNSRICNQSIKTLQLSIPTVVNEQINRKIALFLKKGAKLNKFENLEAMIVANKFITKLNGSFKLRTFLRHFSNALGSLTKLTLQNFEICGSDISDVLGLSPHLEVLHLTSCSFPGNSTHNGVLEVDGPHSRVRDIVLEECHGLKCVKFLHVPQLERLGCDAIPVLSCNSIQHLRHVNISFDAYISDAKYRISEMLADATHIERLSLGFKDSKVWIVPELFPTPLSKLKSVLLREIPLKHDLLWIIFLLQAAPFLEALHVDVTIEFPRAKRMAEKTLPWNASGFYHHHLKELEVFGFGGQRREMRFVRLIMERSVALEIVVLHGNCLRSYWDDGIFSYCPTFCRKLRYRFLKWEEHRKASLLKQLKDGISSSARLIMD